MIIIMQLIHHGSAYRLVQDTIKEGLRNLQEILQNEYEPWKGLVSDVTPEGHITIQTEHSDNFRQGDIFRIFRGVSIEDDISVSHSSCARQRSEQHIAIARLVEANEFSFYP